jgi:WD40 repeat protein
MHRPTIDVAPDNAGSRPPAVDPAQTRLEREFKYPAPLLACRFDPAGKYLFASAQDQTVQRIDLADGKFTTLAGHQSWVRALACHPTEKLLVSGGYDGKLVWWPTDAEKPEPLRTVVAHDGWVRAAAISPDGATVASCGNDNLIKLWSAADSSLLAELRGHESHVYNVAFHPSGTALVSGDLKGVVRQWNVADRKMMRELDAKALYKYDTGFRANIGGPRGVAFSADGDLLACGGITDVSNAFAGVGKPAVVLFDWATGAPRKQLLRPKEEFQGTVWGVAFHPDGFLVAAGGGTGGLLWFWKPDLAESFFTFKLPNNARDLALHPDGARLAVACFDNAARLFTMAPKPA